MAPQSVRAQVVLYDNDPASIGRLVTSLARSATFAIESGALGHCELAFGDCSPQPSVDDQELERLTLTCKAVGIDLSYRFFDANRFHSGGMNALGDGTSSDWLLVLNPDCYVAPRALTELLIAAREPGVAAAEARQVPLEHPKEFDLVTSTTSWFTAACVLVRRDAFHDVGGFDAEFFPQYCNDVDLSWRLRLAGHTLRYVPGAVVFHDKRIDAASGYPELAAIEERSGALGRLMLTARYNRPDLTAETSTWISVHGSDAQRAALAEFEARAAKRAIPEALVGGAIVADFVGSEYGARRY